MGLMETDGASTETENLTREEQRDTIEQRLNKNFQSESTERERGLTWELSESRNTMIVGQGEIGSYQTLVKLGCILNARERATIMA